MPEADSICRFCYVARVSTLHPFRIIPRRFALLQKLADRNGLRRGLPMLLLFDQQLVAQQRNHVVQHVLAGLSRIVQGQVGRAGLGGQPHCRDLLLRLGDLTGSLLLGGVLLRVFFRFGKHGHGRVAESPVVAGNAILPCRKHRLRSCNAPPLCCPCPQRTPTP